jgi:hypothetical protein
VMNPFLLERRVHLSITWACLVVLPCVSHAQLRYFTTSVPKTLPPLYPNTRSAEIPNSSILFILTRNFGTFGTKVSTLQLLKPEMSSSNLLLVSAPQQKFFPCRDFALHDFTNLDARFSVFQPANPQSENSQVIQWSFPNWILWSNLS